jgi:diguanylate cyclase (GGDEF)-like protein
LIPKVESNIPKGSPPEIHPYLIECLDHGSMVVVVLDREGKVGWANQAFWDALKEGKPAGGISFQDLLEAQSVELFSRIESIPPGEVKTLELKHHIPVGFMTISYQFFPCEGGGLCGIGIDRTEEKELIEQMYALVEDLHREMERRSKLSHQLEELAITDFLTGLFNRRQFDKVLQQEWGRMKRYGSQFALLLLDIDHFKQVNDRFGHQAGDEVLRKIAEILRAEVRVEDVVARFGGEEFAIIALNVHSKRARDLADRLRETVEASPMPAGVDQVTISIGSAATSDMTRRDHEEDLIACADKALYIAKERGRNRVEVFPDLLSKRKKKKD